MADRYAAERRKMVERQLARRGISDARVLAAMRRVPRDRFVPADLAEFAYDDNPLPIGEGQTISQPYIVALMAEAARIGPDARVLEVGTRLRLRRRVFAELARDVVSIERHTALADGARAVLKDLGYNNVDGAPRRRNARRGGPRALRRHPRGGRRAGAAGFAETATGRRRPPGDSRERRRASGSRA